MVKNGFFWWILGRERVEVIQCQNISGFIPPLAVLVNILLLRLCLKVTS